MSKIKRFAVAFVLGIACMTAALFASHGDTNNLAIIVVLAIISLTLIVLFIYIVLSLFKIKTTKNK